MREFFQQQLGDLQMLRHACLIDACGIMPNSYPEKSFLPFMALLMVQRDNPQYASALILDTHQDQRGYTLIALFDMLVAMGHELRYLSSYVNPDGNLDYRWNDYQPDIEPEPFSYLMFKEVKDVFPELNPAVSFQLCGYDETINKLIKQKEANLKRVMAYKCPYCETDLSYESPSKFSGYFICDKCNKQYYALPCPKCNGPAHWFEGHRVYYCHPCDHYVYEGKPR